jgi:hypothetical protein
MKATPTHCWKPEDFSAGLQTPMYWGSSRDTVSKANHTQPLGTTLFYKKFTFSLIKSCDPYILLHQSYHN